MFDLFKRQFGGALRKIRARIDGGRDFEQPARVRACAAAEDDNGVVRARELARLLLSA